MIWLRGASPRALPSPVAAPGDHVPRSQASSGSGPEGATRPGVRVGRGGGRAVGPERGLLRVVSPGDPDAAVVARRPVAIVVVLVEKQRPRPRIRREQPVPLRDVGRLLLFGDGVRAADRWEA